MAQGDLVWVDQPRAHGPGNNATRPGHRVASARQGRWFFGEPRGIAPGLVYPSGQRMMGGLGMKRPGVTDPTLFSRSAEPLAARMRPTRLEDFLGQEHLLGPGKALGELIRRGDVGSCIFWGPPGSGKTTLARLIANHTDRHFEPFSAVTEGVARVREIIHEAEEGLKYEGRGTILFCDEIHRFNRAQQDAFLPWVENGIVTLIGATTENPSFELTAPLLSRCRVFVFEPLNDEHVRKIVHRALEQTGCEMRDAGCVSLEGVEALVTYAQGDARRALNGLEAVLPHVHAP